MDKAAGRLALCALLAARPFAAAATGASNDTDAVVVSALRNPVDKSYRRMAEGVARFEERHHLAPQAELRFKLLPRSRATRMEAVELQIVGDSFARPVALAPDHTFALEREPRALKENASVQPNRRAGTLTWRAEIRTPGLPDGVRRLGDLRLECEVGMQAGLISNDRSFLLRIFDPFLREGPEYCRRTVPRYLFFSDFPLWSVMLESGERKEVLPVEMLYGGASRDPDWKDDLPYCDCEVLMDRAYFLPLGDLSWPDDTLLTFEPMSPVGGESGKAQVRAALGEPIAIDFDSGYEVWVYRDRLPDSSPPPARSELVLLFTPEGLLAKTRIR